MSSTVIASRHGASLHLLPAAGPALDRDALRQVLDRHGIELLDGSDLDGAHEFIAAQGLEPAAAAALAEDLRGIGLSARVVNQVALTTSRRVGNALAAQVFVAMAGMLVAAANWKAIAAAERMGGDPPGLAVIAVALGVVAMLVAAFNAITLQRHGGFGLRVAGTRATDKPATPLLSEQLASLAGLLPEHLALPLLTRARKLEGHARQDPDGQAARELTAIVAELRGQADEQAASEARQLREEVAAARRALLETQGR